MRKVIKKRSLEQVNKQVTKQVKKNPLLVMYYLNKFDDVI